KDPNLEIIPVIETGTQDQDQMPEKLKQYYPSVAPIDGGNVDALKTLDVIVANPTWRTSDELSAAVEAAVKSGVGLLNVAGMGKETPGYGPDTPVTAHLAGLFEGAYAYNPNAVKCKILADHPLLGKMSGRRGRTVQLWPNGV